MKNVMIEDDLDNWLRWGNLINDWINNNPAKPRPTTVAELKTAMAGDGVIGIVHAISFFCVSTTVMTFAGGFAPLELPTIRYLPSGVSLGNSSRSAN